MKKFGLATVATALALATMAWATMSWVTMSWVTMSWVTMSTAQAQAPEGGHRGRTMGPPHMGAGYLLMQKSVQDELKLTDEQLASLKKLAEKALAGGHGSGDQSGEDRRKHWREEAKTREEEIGKILQPAQLSRLKQIALQVQGPMAFSSPEVDEALKLTADQKDKMKAAQEVAWKDLRALREKNGDANRDEARKKMMASRKAVMEKLLEVLTSDQQAKWKEMVGEPFKGEIHRPEFRGGQRGPRGGSEETPRKET